MTALRQLELTAPAVGGEALGREADGRVVFVSGGAPGDLVEFEVTEEKRRFARGRVTQVLRASPDRVELPCPHVAEGCGGCDWQHLVVEAQRRYRRDLVSDALGRQGGVEDPVVLDGPDVPIGTRTTIRGVADPAGRFSFRRRRSNEPVPVSDCLIAHPLLEDLLGACRFPVGAEVTLRVGARTGERMAIIDHHDRSLGVDESLRDIEVPDDVTVVTGAALRAGRRSWFHEEVAGRRWRISARSFFQSSPEGAEALVDTVSDQLRRFAPDARRMVDLYAGVGLFAGTVGVDRDLVVVERNRSSVADARVNLAGLDARILELSVASWRPDPADVVIADPARRGLERAGAEAIAATGASTAVLVTCDVGALGRDTRLLADAGYRHVESAVIDLFPHTSAVEIVSAYRR